ncbi:hypothetical protein Tco_1373038, partial [Tanacetum coccineum]
MQNTTSPLSILPDFASVFQFKDRITALEKEVAKLKKDPLHTQSLTARIKEQVKDQLPQILPKEVSDFAPPVIEALIKESRDKVTLAKVSSQTHYTYEAASTLTEFKLKRILIDKMEKSKSYLAAPEHRDCYDNKDENHYAGSDRGLKKRKLSKDSEPTTIQKERIQHCSSKGTKSQPKSFGKSIQSEEPVFEVADSDMPQDQEGNLGDNLANMEARRHPWGQLLVLLIISRSQFHDLRPRVKEEKAKQRCRTNHWFKKERFSVWLFQRHQVSTEISGKSVQSEEPVFEVADSDMPQDQEGNLGDNEDETRNESASIHDWFKKPTPPQEPTDPNWYVGKTILEGPTQNWLMTLAASTSTDKSLKDFDELMSTPIDFSGYILNGLKIKKNPKGGDYPFDLSKPLPLITRGKCQRVPFEYFINNDLKYLQGGVLTMTYTTSTTKTKAAQYDLPGIEDKSFYAYARGRQSRGDVYSTKRILAVTHVKNWLTNLSGDDLPDFAIALRMFTRSLINVTKPDTTRPDLRKRHPYTPYKDPQGFIYVDEFKRNMLMRSDELYKFSDGTLTRLLSSLKDITKNIDMKYLPKRRWSTL